MSEGPSAQQQPCRGTPVDAQGEILAGYADRWSMDVRLWWRDFDAYDHLTAASYPMVFAEVFGQYMMDTWGDSDPDFVVADLAVSYLREVRRADSPVRVYVGIDRVGRSGFSSYMVLCAADGTVRSTARNRYVAWDPVRRCSRPMTAAERSALLDQGLDAGGRNR